MGQNPNEVQAARLALLSRDLILHHRYPEAVETASKALALAQHLPNEVLKAAILSMLGLARKRTGRFTEALRDLEEAIVIKQKHGNQADLPADLTNAANIYVELGQLDKALQYLELCLRLRDKDKDPARHGADLCNLGVIYKKRHDYERAKSYFEQALEVQQRADDQGGVATDLNNLGEIGSIQGKYDEAIELISKALDLRKAIGDYPGEADSANHLGHIHLLRGRLEEALECYSRGVRISQQLGDRFGEALYLMNTAHVYAAKEQYAEAIKIYEDARSIHQEMSQATGVADCLVGLSGACYCLGRFDDAQRFAESSLKAAREISDPDREAFALDALGNVQFERGDYNEALGTYQTALGLWHANGQVREEAHCLIHLANTCLSLGKGAEADSFYERAREKTCKYEDFHVALDGSRYRASVNVMLHATPAECAQYKEAMRSEQCGFWIPASHLLRWPRFVRHQESLAIRGVQPNLPPVRLFVSHRWVHASAPDPMGVQSHIVLRFLFEAICLSKGICERFFSFGLPEIALNGRLRNEFANYQPALSDWCRDPSTKAVRFQEYIATDSLLHLWLKAQFPALVVEWDEIRQVASVLRDVGIWYDFSCMPQRPFRHSVEKTFFDRSLQTLPSLITASHTLIAWDEKALKRGWCVFEGMVAEQKGVANYVAVPRVAGGIGSFDDHLGASGIPLGRRIQTAIIELARSLGHRSAKDIEEYFKANGIAFTHREDAKAVCRLLADHLNRNGFQEESAGS